MKEEVLFFSKENSILSLKKCNILGKKSRGAQDKWLENTRNFPSEEIPLGYRLRSPLPPGEEPCPLSLAHGFLATHPSLSAFNYTARLRRINLRRRDAYLHS
jgi:hypothetical protein